MGKSQGETSRLLWNTDTIVIHQRKLYADGCSKKTSFPLLQVHRTANTWPANCPLGFKNQSTTSGSYNLVPGRAYT